MLVMLPSLTLVRSRIVWRAAPQRSVSRHAGAMFVNRMMNDPDFAARIHARQAAQAETLGGCPLGAKRDVVSESEADASSSVDGCGDGVGSRSSRTLRKPSQPPSLRASLMRFLILRGLAWASSSRWAAVAPAIMAAPICPSWHCPFVGGRARPPSNRPQRLIEGHLKLALWSSGALGRIGGPRSPAFELREPRTGKQRYGGFVMECFQSPGRRLIRHPMFELRPCAELHSHHRL